MPVIDWALIGLLGVLIVMVALAPWPQVGPFVHRGRHRKSRLKRVK